ncbi:MAG TPA: hypothetical protein DCY13_14040, partial [Verrucomicrobiales bacterium]|nr:hypothetical protein [Verrucomicrobiales bacterium]
MVFDDTAGREKLASYDSTTGLLTIGINLGGSGTSFEPEWKYVPVRRYLSHFDGRFLTAVDLNNDQLADIILPGYAANKLLVIWGHDLDQTVIEPELLDVGAGPIAAAAAELRGGAPTELLVATAGAPQFGVRGWDLVQKQAITGTTGYPPGFAQEGLLGFATAGSSAGAANPILAILRRDAGSNGRSTLQLFSRSPLPAYGPSNSTHLSTQTITYTGLESGHPLGDLQAGWFMAWGTGLSQVTMVSSAGGAAQLHDLGAPIAKAALYRGAHSGGANFLFADGRVRFYDFHPVNGFTLRQQLTPPLG